MSIQPVTPTTPPGRARALVTGLLLAALALGAVSGCAKTGKSADKANQGLSDVDGTGGTGATPDAGSSGSGTDGSGGASASASASPKPSNKPSSAPAGPRISVFAATVKASCGSPGGPGFDAVPGTVTLAWTVLGGATMVGLSIDDTATFKQFGHGSWKDYPAVGGDTVPFACDGAAGNKTHTYTIDTIGGGAHTSKTLTLTAYWQGPPNP